MQMTLAVALFVLPPLTPVTTQLTTVPAAAAPVHTPVPLTVYVVPPVLGIPPVKIPPRIALVQTLATFS